MAIVFLDVVQPKGKLHPELFPQYKTTGAFTTAVEAWIASGVAEATARSILSGSMDRATLAWTYYRGYSNIHQRLAGAASVARIDAQGSREYDTRQAAVFLELANEALAEFEELVPIADSVPRGRPYTSSFRNRYRF